MGITIHKRGRVSGGFILGINWEDELESCTSTKRGVELVLTEGTLDAIRTAFMVKDVHGECI